MGIIYPQNVCVSAAGDLYQHLLQLGYAVKYREKIEINVEHLMPRSSAFVLVRCDFCGDIFSRSYAHIDKSSKISCAKCKGRHVSESKIKSLPAKQQIYHDREWLNHQYIELGRSARDIANECGVIVQTIEAELIRHQIKKMPTLEDAKLVLQKEVLYDMYVRQGIGISSISKKFPRIGVKTIRKLMDEYEIPMMTSSDLHRLFWENSGNRDKMSEIRKELWRDDDYRCKTVAHLQDEQSIRERAVKYSANRQGISVDEWDHFLTPYNDRIRCSVEYDRWRSMVFERDGYTCQCCGAKSQAGTSVSLRAHHLESFASNESLRFDVDNGVTLCDNCHDPHRQNSFHSVYGTLNNTKDQYQEYIANK